MRGTFYKGQGFSVSLNGALSLAEKDKRVDAWAGPSFPVTICVIGTSDIVQRSRAEANTGRDELNRVCSDVSHGRGRSWSCRREEGAQEEVKLDATQEQSFDPQPD